MIALSHGDKRFDDMHKCFNIMPVFDKQTDRCTIKTLLKFKI